MKTRTLLERLSDPRSDLPGNSTIGDLAESIRGHLQRMLNTRQGGSVSAPDYGMPDVTEASRTCPDTVDELAERIRGSIERYEPRLEDVGVRFLAEETDVLRLVFEVRARLRTPDDEAGVLFNTYVGGGGKVSVKL